MTFLLTAVLVLSSVEYLHPTDEEVTVEYEGRSNATEKYWDQQHEEIYMRQEVNEHRIIGGKHIDITESPTYVAISIMVGSSIVLCGGNLITPSHVLTAAHCVTKTVGESTDGRFIRYETLPPDEINVRLGSTYYDRDGTILDAKKLVVHPDYLTRLPTIAFRDIAVIQLDGKVTLGYTVQTVEFYPEMSKNKSENLEGMECRVSGWGFTNSKGSLSQHLKQAQVSLINNDACRFYYMNRVNSGAQVCALTRHTDSCQGDSGGGLFCEGKLIALTSWGWGCAAGSPGVYARVDNQQDFIRNALLGTPAATASVLLVPMLTLTTQLL